MGRKIKLHFEDSQTNAFQRPIGSPIVLEAMPDDKMGTIFNQYVKCISHRIWDVTFRQHNHPASIDKQKTVEELGLQDGNTIYATRGDVSPDAPKRSSHTLRVTGIDKHLKAHQIKSLFKVLTEGLHIVTSLTYITYGKGGKTIFVSFPSKSKANDARKKLQGMPFGDPTVRKLKVLNVEFAKHDQKKACFIKTNIDPNFT